MYKGVTALTKWPMSPCQLTCYNTLSVVVATATDYQLMVTD